MQKTLLHQLEDAAWDGDLAGVQFLLEAGANPRAAHSCALLHAAHRAHPPIVELLLAAGADPVARRSEALHRAAKGMTARHRACVRLLLPVSNPRAWENWEWEDLNVSARKLCEESVKGIARTCDTSHFVALTPLDR